MIFCLQVFERKERAQRSVEHGHLMPALSLDVPMDDLLLLAGVAVFVAIAAGAGLSCRRRDRLPATWDERLAGPRQTCLGVSVVVVAAAAAAAAGEEGTSESTVHPLAGNGKEESKNLCLASWGALGYLRMQEKYIKVRDREKGEEV
ncbi:hypothetical protein ACLOJK_032303 [Asimina triloba]